MTYIIGIDIGVTGGIAYLGTQQPLASVEPMPVAEIQHGKHVRHILDTGSLVEKLKPFSERNTQVFYEEMRIQPGGLGQSAMGAAAYGRMLGAIEAICLCLGLPCTAVSPKDWQREMLAGMNTTDRRGRKLASIARAHQLFPGVSLRPTEKCKKDSDGMADAVLIAEYGRRKLN